VALQNWADGGILLGIQFANATIGYVSTRTASFYASLQKTRS
jgi:hypothetical protein